jgi:cold shock CspA family protein
MLIGILKWFKADNGFGVVGTPDEKEYFLHINSFAIKPRKLIIGTPIAFSISTKELKDRKSAENSRIVENSEDWAMIFDYLGKSDNVKIEVKVTGKGKRGNPFQYKEIQSLSLIEVSLKYILKNKSEDEISNYIIDYFDTKLETQYFIKYCEIIECFLTKHLSSTLSNNILNRIFSHFGNNYNNEILFDVWKQNKFKFISYNEMHDFEIPESVLKANIFKVGKSELSRILKFSYAHNFTSYFIENKFSDIENLSTIEIHDLYQFIEFENENEQEKRKNEIDNLYARKIEIELTEKANELNTIKNDNDFNNYNRLLLLIPKHFNENLKNKITNEIHNIISKKCDEDYKVNLWIKNIIENVPFELVSKYFHDHYTQTENRVSILIKLQSEQQFELLKKYSNDFTFQKGFTLIERLVEKENSIYYSFNILKVIFDTEFWKDKKTKYLLFLFTKYINDHVNDEQKYDLFLNGYIKNVPIDFVLNNINKIEKEDCNKIFKNISEDKSLIKDILLAKITIDNTDALNWLYNLAIEFLDDYNFILFDNKVFNTIEQTDYFKFWEKGKAKIFPHNEIEKILQDKFENYEQIKTWIINNPNVKDKISDFLFSFLQKQQTVTNRIIFYKQLNHIKYLLQLDESYFDKIKKIKNDFYNVILWVIDQDNFFDFELLKQKFIYFEPDEQVRIIRKLFFLKSTGQFDLNIEKLDQLTRFDLDLYKTNLKFNPDIPIDISTDVLIKVLSSYKKNNRFFIESELITVVLNDLMIDKTRRFSLANYFEKCLGRLTDEYNWKTQGTISKVNYGENKYYFAIAFDYNPNLVEAVKLLPGRKWNNETKVWVVPSIYENEVLYFAKEYRFFLDFEGDNYKNNIHLVEFKRTTKKTINKRQIEVPNIPNGITFCEGRLANKQYENYKKQFWWCGGQKCFGKCETIHNKDEWEKYTLLDFCEILGLNTDETNKMGDYIPKGHYYQFIALINRFNRLLVKLYCQDCNHILYPSDFGTSHFAAHTVVRFQCRNDACSNNDEIYLNHCLNGQCNCIIDSRISQRCDNGLFICDNCGSCCSHNMLERRLSNLRLTGGYIHDNLVKCVNEKLGHLERGEYFCYKCKSEMTEISNDIFQCSNCNVKYDTTKYKFKRPHIHLRKKKTT